MDQANEVRGEIDLELEGERFVLRPSYEAIQACEKATGRSLIDLALDADRGTLRLDHAAIVTAELIRAWGRADGKAAAAGVNAERIGELIFEFGLMRVQPRLALVLTQAATGGCLPSGEAKTAGTTTIPETPAVA